MSMAERSDRQREEKDRELEECMVRIVKIMHAGGYTPGKTLPY